MSASGVYPASTTTTSATSTVRSTITTTRSTSPVSGLVAPVSSVSSIPVSEIVKAAHATLGFGYNPETRSLSEVRVLKPTTNENIEVFDVQIADRASFENRELRAGNESASFVALNSNLRIECQIPSSPFLHLHLNPQGALGAVHRPGEEGVQGNYLGTVRKTDFFSAKYGFISVPRVNEEVNPDARESRYTGSGSLYAGYIVEVTVYGKKKENPTSADYIRDLGLCLIKEMLDFDIPELRARKVFEVNRVTYLEVRAQGMGFTFPERFFSKDPSRFTGAMKSTHQHFLDTLPTLVPVHHFNRVRDTFPLIYIPRNSSEQPVGTATSSTAQGLVLTENGYNLQNDLEFYEGFVREIWKLSSTGYSDTLRNALGKYKLAELLWKIRSVFPHTLAEIRKLKDHAPCYKTTIVYGGEGVGKSLLIGVLLGAGLTVNTDPLDLQPRNSNMRLPVVGHLDGQTLGASVFRSAEHAYVDTQGLGTSGGEGANLCGAPAIHAMVRACQPQRVILVIQPGAFDSKGKMFFKQMKLLGKVIDVVRGFSSVLVVVNDHNVKINRATGEPWSEVDVADKIQIAIATLKAQLGKRAPNFAHMLHRVKEMWSSNPSDGDDSLQEEAQTVEELHLQIHLLEQLLVQRNFVYTNLLDPKKFIARVEEWQRNSPSLSLSQFHMDRLAGEVGFGTFQQVITAVTEYYLRVHGMLEDIQKTRSRMKERLKDIADQLEFLAKGAEDKKAIEERKRIKEALLTQTRLTNELRIEEIRQNLQGEDSEGGLERRIRDLQTSTKLSVLTRMAPIETPTPRSVGAYFDSWTHTYEFPLDNIPSNVCGFKLRQVKGTYYVWTKDARGTRERQPLISGQRYETLEKISGVEALKFRPAYFGWEEDRKAALVLLCQLKDNPSTEKEMIQPLRIQIHALREELGFKRDEIMNLVREVTALTLSMQSEEQRVEQYNQLEQEKNRLEKKLREEGQNRQNAQTLWDTYNPFRLLIKDVLETFYQYSYQTMTMDPAHVRRFLSLGD